MSRRIPLRVERVYPLPEERVKTEVYLAEGRPHTGDHACRMPAGLVKPYFAADGDPGLWLAAYVEDLGRFNHQGVHSRLVMSDGHQVYADDLHRFLCLVREVHRDAAVQRDGRPVLVLDGPGDWRALDRAAAMECRQRGLSPEATETVGQSDARRPGVAGEPRQRWLFE